MRAVVKLAIGNMLLQIGHTRSQLILRNVLKAKLLKAWRINDGGTPQFQIRQVGAIAYPIK
jgi:hypothetical protein